MTGGESSDSDLIVGSWEESELFGEIFERHYAAVFGFVGAAVGRDAAGDIAAEVFVRAFQLRRRFRTEYRSARPWLFGIASNLVSDHYRRQARQHRAYQRSVGRESATVDFEDEAVARSDAGSVSDLLTEALKSLRAEEVAVVALFVLEDMSYAEISETLGIPEGTVRSRLSRARARLRNLVGSWDEQDKGGFV